MTDHLAAENARLREALTKIAGCTSHHPQDVVAIARAALTPQDHAAGKDDPVSRCSVGSCRRHGRCMYLNHPRCPLAALASAPMPVGCQHQYDTVPADPSDEMYPQGITACLLCGHIHGVAPMPACGHIHGVAPMPAYQPGWYRHDQSAACPVPSSILIGAIQWIEGGTHSFRPAPANEVVEPTRWERVNCYLIVAPMPVEVEGLVERLRKASVSCAPLSDVNRLFAEAADTIESLSRGGGYREGIEAAARVAERIENDATMPVISIVEAIRALAPDHDGGGNEQEG